MDARLKIGNPYLPQPIQTRKQNDTQPNHPLKSNFEHILSEQITKRNQSVTLSQHADQRLKSRGIEMTPELMKQLERAVDKAEAKGSRDALVIMDQLAFVVSIKNRTVITAMDQESMKENVFTNIDSTVLM